MKSDHLERLKAHPIELIRVALGCPTPDVCFQLAYLQCKTLLHVLANLGYQTHPTLTGLWQIPPKQSKQMWTEKYGKTPSIKVQNGSLEEMQQQVHDYLAFFPETSSLSCNAPLNLMKSPTETTLVPETSSPTRNVPLDVTKIPTEMLSIFATEYEKRHNKEGPGSNGDAGTSLQIVQASLLSPCPRSVDPTNVNQINIYVKMS